MNHASSVLIRYALVALFLWFGFHQLFDPAPWVSYLPSWIGYFPIPPETVIRMNGWFEIVFAAMLGAGLLTRFVALVLGVHLLGIASTALGAVGMRDATLGLVALAVAWSPPDAWTLDRKLSAKAPAPATTAN